MKKVLILTVAFVFCASMVYAGENLKDKLNGAWTSGTVTVFIDFEKGTFRGVQNGRKFNRTLEFVEEYANVVEFKTDVHAYVCMFQNKEYDSISLAILSDEMDIPKLLTRWEE